ncbi:polysaccharide biosynthesis tyrosine autokinase [Yoonia sp.]|uniref:polysaccharide biosynthesis tyrosine autokinase n=1 Tax=Yoonia sp. TaxID=2212373 RepID=UPI00391DB52A
MLNKPLDTADDEIDLGELVSTLWRGRWRIAALTLLGAALAALHVANTHPTYQADALLQLEERSGALALPSSLSSMVENDPRSVTEIEILRSRMVLGRAISDQNLDWRVTPDTLPVIGTLFARHHVPLLDAVVPNRFARPGDRVTLANFIVPPEMLNQGIDLIVTGQDSYRVILPDATQVEGNVGEPINLAETGFAITVAELAAPAERRFTLTQIDERRAINALRSRMSVSEVGRGSGILEVRLTGLDRTDNARALSAIVQSYQAQNVSRSAAEAESSLSFIRDQLPQAEENMREAEAAVNAFRQQQVTVDLSLETQTILGQVTRVETELADLQRREGEIAERFTPAHPTYRQLLEERERLETRLANLRGQIGELPETQRQILNLTREVEMAQRIYTELLTRAQEVEVLRASTIGNVRVVDDASSSPAPVAPRRSMILGLGLVLGMFAGIALVLVTGWLRKGVQDPSELEKLGLPVFATINYNKGADTASRRSGHLPILALAGSADLTVEALRSLRTSLHFGMLDAATPTVTMTSSHPGAGKSFLSANLAAVIAQAGQRACVIDADLRRGQLRRYFDVARDSAGLAEVLSGDLSCADAILQGPHENLFFLPTGRYPPNPSELLMRAELTQLITYCAENFDFTIFDAPPVLAVTDPVILARSTGASIFVARHDKTHLGEVDAAQKAFDAAGLRFSGAVLNGYDPKKAAGRKGYGYNYRYEYKQREN